MEKLDNQNYRNKALGAFYGLAIGDALGVESEGKTHEQIKSKWGLITDFVSTEPAGSDDTEFAVLNTLLLKKYGIKISSKDFYYEWKNQIASIKIPMKGAGFSELMTVKNIRNSLTPPDSGFHLHSWSDGLAMRVVPFGIVSDGNIELAKKLTIEDGSVTHSGEGLNGGIAAATAISAAFKFKETKQIIEATLCNLNKDCWTYRAIKEATKIGLASDNLDDCLVNLNKEIVCDYYYWADLAPEAVALSFGVLAFANGDFSKSVIAGVNVGRDTDTIAAICGAISGAMNGFDKIPSKWTKKIFEVKGSCIKSVASIKIEDCVDILIKLRNNNGI